MGNYSDIWYRVFCCIRMVVVFSGAGRKELCRTQDSCVYFPYSSVFGVYLDRSMLYPFWILQVLIAGS